LEAYVRVLLLNVIIKAALVSGLFLWGVTATIYATSKESKTVLIGIDENGTRIIENKDDPLFKTEVVAFIRHFSLLLYNFDSQTYVENVGSASDLMSTELWEELEISLKAKRNVVDERHISHSGVVEQIIKSDDFQYDVLLKGYEQRQLKRVERFIKLQLVLNRKDRTNINPWGIEVAELKEVPVE
jgi:hypothetical protein